MTDLRHSGSEAEIFAPSPMHECNALSTRANKLGREYHFTLAAEKVQPLGSIAS